MNINEKFVAFEKICLMEAENKRLEMLKEIEIKINDEIDMFTAAEKAKADEKLEFFENETRKHTNLELSNARVEANKELLTKKEEYIDKIFESVKNKLYKYAESEEYLEILKTKVESYLDKNSGSTVCLLDRDIKLKFLDADNSYKERIYVSSVDFIGGFKGIPKGKIKIEDFTFYSGLMEEKQGFNLSKEKSLEAEIDG